MGRSIRSITNPRLSLNILSPEDVRRIHTATLDVIENVGVRFPSPRALEIWEAFGADVDRESMIVKAPGSLIEGASEEALHRLTAWQGATRARTCRWMETTSTWALTGAASR